MQPLLFSLGEDLNKDVGGVALTKVTKAHIEPFAQMSVSQINSVAILSVK